MWFMSLSKNLNTDCNGAGFVVYKYFPFVLLTLLVLTSCASLPPNINAPKTYALQDTNDTKFAKKSRLLIEKSNNESGFFLLSNSLDAYTARIAIIRHAERSIDAQYYMIHNDLTGILFGEQLIKAADRGIRVRLLLDDMDLADRDEGLATVASHPNISIRVFNPFIRSFRSRTSQFLTQFGSVTRRMHNKSLTIDNQITIVGGRNIGDEYFDADPYLAFADLDILAIGPVVKEVSASFDEYWNSALAYPIEILRPDITGEESYAEGIEALEQYVNRDEVYAYKKRIVGSGLFKNLQNNTVSYSRGTATVLSDHPDKLTGYDTDSSLILISQFNQYLKLLKTEFIIFSPYFVPGKTGTELLSNLSKNGIRVRILTNSLASTDVGIVHAGYAKYRTTLLRAGVELYEMNKVLSREKHEEKRGTYGSSKASLHAKSFVLDRKNVFIGSLNLDPRSIVENTEIGIMVSSEDLAEEMVSGFDYISKNLAFRLELITDDNGIEHIRWHGLEKGAGKTWNSDPYTSAWQRFCIFILGLMPIESQL